MFRECLWDALNDTFEGKTSIEIQNVRCYEYADGNQDIFINYVDGFSRRIEKVEVFYREVIDSWEENIPSGHMEYYILHDSKIYPFYCDFDDVYSIDLL